MLLSCIFNEGGLFWFGFVSLQWASFRCLMNTFWLPGYSASHIHFFWFGKTNPLISLLPVSTAAIRQRQKSWSVKEKDEKTKQNKKEQRLLRTNLSSKESRYSKHLTRPSVGPVYKCAIHCWKSYDFQRARFFQQRFLGKCENFLCSQFPHLGSRRETEYISW